MFKFAISKKNLVVQTCFITLCCVAFNAFSQHTSTSDLFFDSFAAQTSSLGTVRVIRQDKAGYMWFGGFDGLVKFDGYNYKNYQNDFENVNSISSNSINDILVDQRGMYG